MPTFSILDTKPLHILNFPLTVQQQLWLLFFLPTVWLTIVYIVDIATDIAVGLELINEGHCLPASLTMSFIFLPPLLSYFIRLSSPPDTKELKVVLTWFSVETAAFLFFPIRPLQCFAERLFWSIEAIRMDDPYREEALIEFENTQAYVIENYMFMQALLQAGPQAILQMHFVSLRTSKYPSTVAIQILSLITSLASFAMVAASYQRYEMQVRGGRNQVWPSTDRSLTTLLQTSSSDNNATHQRSQWVKVMDEDNPLGSILSFSFWFFFLLGRITCLVIAFNFFPWVVISVCSAHYLFSLAYIMPIPKFKSSIPIKIILALIYIFCLMEVGIQFRKANLLYTLFFFITIIENISLTLLWSQWAIWNGIWYNYCLYLLVASHGLAIGFLAIYFKYFKPKIRRVEIRKEDITPF